MASIITATTSSGLTQSADLSGVLQLASGTGNLVTVPSVTGTAMVSGNMPAFSAYSSTSQSISNATNTKVTYDVEDYDTANCYSSSRFTPNVAGYYNICAYYNFVAAANINQIQVYKNGSQLRISTNNNTLNGNGNQITQQMYLNGTTDYVEIYIFQNSGGSASISGGQNSSAFQGILVRTA